MEHVQLAHRVAVLPEASSVKVVARCDGARVVLLVEGEADAHTSRALRSALISALGSSPQSVEVDVGNLSFCDLAGSDALHDFTDEARARAIPVDFLGMSPLLRMLYTRFPPPGPSRGQVGMLPEVADV